MVGWLVDWQDASWHGLRPQGQPHRLGRRIWSVSLIYKSLKPCFDLLIQGTKLQSAPGYSTFANDNAVWDLIDLLAAIAEETGKLHVCG